MEELGFYREHPALAQRQTTVLTGPTRREIDVFDVNDFNLTKLVNTLYPNEASLVDVDKFGVVLKKRIQQVDKEIYEAVRSRGGAHARARQDLSVAHGQIMELFAKLTDIQRKSEESEAMVQEICRDIRKLDTAKRHLTNSITALRRLAMLTAAVTDLEAVCQKREQYRKAANLVEAVHQLMEYFQQYEAIPKVRSLARRLAGVESQLQASVLDDFKILVGGPITDGLRMAPENLERLGTVCLVVDALGRKIQDQAMDWLCDREMNIYQTAFGGSAGSITVSAAAADDRGAAEAAAHATRLDLFERRFGWFRARLEEKREVWSVFPEHWRVPQVLCLTFCKITKAHLKRILSDEEALAGLRGDVSPLLKAAVATNRFERDMAAVFGGGAGRQGGEDADDEVDGGDSMSASEARRRLEKFRARVKAEQQAKKDAVAKAGDRAREAQEEAIKVAFEGAVSEAFEGVLVEHFVRQEEVEHLEHLDAVVREEAERRWLPDEEEGDVSGSGMRILQSANKIFFKIRASLTRCVKNVSRGPTLVALAQLFKRVLSGYAAELLRRLPRTAAGAVNATPGVVGGNTDWYIRLSEDDERMVCCLLATSEVCRETVEGLAGALVKDVKPQLADRVDFGEVESAFVQLASACMNVLVLGLNTRLDGPLQDMMRMRWDSLEAAGDDSPWVHALRKVLLDAAPRLGAGLDSANLAFMCDKLARSLIPRLHESLLRLRRPLGDKGLLQLAVDMDAVRRALLEFPRAALSVQTQSHGGHSSDGQELPTYSAYVDRELGILLARIKVLQSRPEHLADTYLLLLPPQAQSLMEFQRLCELKGLARKQQSDLMAIYQLKAGQLGASGGPAGRGPAGGPVAGGASTPGGGDVGLSGAAAANLGTFKVSMNNFTRELAASIPFPGKPSNVHTRTGSVEAAPGGAPSGSGTAAAGAFFKETAAKTKEGFAKIGNLIRVANALAGSAEGADGSHH